MSDGSNFKHLYEKDAVGGIVCPTCKGLLVPIDTGVGDDISFGCSEGHIARLHDLFTVQSAALRPALNALIAAWELSINQMAESAKEARLRGLYEVSERVHRRIGNLEGRIQILRDAFLKADPSTPSEDSHQK